MLISGVVILGYRKINIAKILPNPLGKPKVEEITKLSEVIGVKTQKKLFMHTVFMMGFGSAVGAFSAK